MNNNFENMMNSMMENMMNSMMEKMMESMMNSMMNSFGVATSAPAEIEPEVKKVKKLSADDLAIIELSKELDKSSKPELGYWESVSRDGKPYRWFGWANPETGERVFPGKQLYHVNDFYLKRDYGAYHPGKTTSYKFKDGGLNAVLTQYKVHTEVEPKDSAEFIKFMKAKEDKKASQVHDGDVYTNWCKHTK